MVQVNLAVVMGVLIILTGIALVGIQVMDSKSGEMQNQSFKLIGAEAGATKSLTGDKIYNFRPCHLKIAI